MNFSRIENLENSVSPHWLNELFRAFVLVVTCLICCAGCGYPKIGEKAYEISKALYSTCNLKREKDLDKVSEVIEQAFSASELSESESEWLMAIVEQARSGEWESAEQEVRSIMEDQTDL